MQCTRAQRCGEPKICPTLFLKSFFGEEGALLEYLHAGPLQPCYATERHAHPCDHTDLLSSWSSLTSSHMCSKFGVDSSSYLFFREPLITLPMHWLLPTWVIRLTASTEDQRIKISFINANKNSQLIILVVINNCNNAFVYHTAVL